MDRICSDYQVLAGPENLIYQIYQVIISIIKYSDQALQLSYIFVKATTDVMKNIY